MERNCSHLNCGLCVFIVHLTETLRQSNVQKKLLERIDLQIPCKRASFQKKKGILHMPFRRKHWRLIPITFCTRDISVQLQSSFKT